MAKEVALTKIAKISKAQQNMILAVLGASLFLGAAISLTLHFIKQISYNAKVIAAQEESVANYSNIIKTTGVCKAPQGDIYTDKELNDCDPDNIQSSEVEGSLRYNILEVLAANQALSSVPKVGDSGCKNPETNKNYTYTELKNAYKNATNVEDRQAAIKQIKTCSALRIIPDALPAFKNEEALLSSLNFIFTLSGWTPESLSPTEGSSDVEESLAAGLNPIEVHYKVEADTATTMNVLRNIERSIREFNPNKATIEWSGDNSLTAQVAARAYYADEATITESDKTISEGGK